MTKRKLHLSAICPTSPVKVGRVCPALLCYTQNKKTCVRGAPHTVQGRAGNETYIFGRGS